MVKKIKKKGLSKKKVLIKLENITKQFHDKVILKNINLEIKKGEIFGIIGKSGSGKTTLLNLIIGFFQPESGKIYYNHENKLININENLRLIHKKFGFAPQKPSFYPKLTALENLEHFGFLYNMPKPVILANVQELLKLTKLEYAKNVLAGELSFGMQKRLGIVCSLVHKPEILILDEPTADLDPILTKDIFNLILKIKQHTTVIIASHFLEEIGEICDRVGIIKDGRIIKSSTVDEIIKSFSLKQGVVLKTRLRKYKEFVKELKKTKSIKIKKITTENNSIKIQSKYPEKAVLQILKINKKIKDEIIELKINKPTLTELFEIIQK